MAPTQEEYVIIVAGGTGTRLWPWSRTSRPKQFLPLFEDKTFLEQVYQRAQKVVSIENIFIVAPENYSEYLTKYLPGFPLTNFMGEPAKKGTTAAYGYTATYIKQLNPNAILHIIAADDFIKDEDRYAKALNRAAQIVKENDALVIYGAKPRDPNPGYGYVQVDPASFLVKSFHEKPPVETAKQYLASDDYYWHVFGFTVTVSKLLSLIGENDPETSKVLTEIEADLKLPARLETKKLAEHYSKLIESNIDNQILEKGTANTYMVVLEETWSDIGTWDHIYALKEKNADGNVIFGDLDRIYAIDAKNSLIAAHQKPIALVGINDLVIIDTQDILMVCAKDKAQDVKKMVDLLKEKKLDKYI